MGVYEKRKDGVETQSFTCRIPKTLYDDVKEFAYIERISISLAIEKLLKEGFRSLEKNRESEP